MAQLTEAQFDERFTLIDGRDDSAVLEWEEIKGVPLRYVWTWVDGDRGEACLIPDIHFVNRFGYAITKEPWTDDIECVVMDFPEPEPDENDPQPGEE